jgi:glycosyltransferase involved in cell wall biosynthesis
VQGLKFQYVGPTRLSRFWDRVHTFPLFKFLYYWAYNAWQRAAFTEAKKLLKTQHFDLVHHITYTSFRAPGYLYKLKIPFFWGPIAGASDEPWSYIKTFNLFTKMMLAMRMLLNAYQKRFSPKPRNAARYASKIWTATPSDYNMVNNLWKCKATIQLDTGCISAAERNPVQKKENEKLKLVWSGLHLPRKALPVTLHALAKAGYGVELSILGAGNETMRWKELATKLGLDADVKWLGWLPHQDAVIEMSKAHVFIFSSISEATSTVVLEALGLGLPVICHDACGMGVAVTDDCGIKIPLQSPQKSIEGFSDAIVRLRDEPGLITKLSEGALKRAQQLTWENKAKEIAQSYCEAISVGVSK